MIGKVLDHYRIVEKVGAGGMGEVYRAYDERLERDVAIKVLPSGALAEESVRRRFRTEALALSKLNHPNIATVHDFDRADGVDFLVMEYIAGVTLSDRLAQASLPEREIVRLAVQLAEGLTAAHEQGVLHRDLKPANLKVTPDGRLKILDFGLAKLLTRGADFGSATGEGRTETHVIGGTLPYMAPEQLRFEAVDHRADIWAAGVVLCEIATRRRPFEASTPAALAVEIQTRPATAPSSVDPGISPALEQIVLKCLEKDRGLRYQSARDLLADLRRLEGAAEHRAPTPGASTAATQAGTDRTRFATGISRPVQIALIGVVLAAMVAIALKQLQTPAAAPRRVITSLAVLPLANLARDPAQEYIVEALHDALIMELSKISALRVISRTSTMRYRGSGRPLTEIASELDVDAVVEGSLLRSGSRLRISAQLIQVDPERHLWADKFDRDVTDVLYLTSDVAQSVAEQVRVTLTPAERVQLSHARQVNPAAYELYAMGRHYWSRRTIADYRKAIESFRKALGFDAGYAPAYAALADTYILLGEQGGLPQKEARQQAAAAIRKALELDANLAEAHASLGQWKFYFEWNWAEAEQAYKRAIELNPGYTTAHQLYGRGLGHIGRFAEALDQLQRARQLDPLSVIVNAYLGQIYLYARQYDRAAEQLERTLELNPDHALVRHNLGELYLAQGRFAEAISQLEKSIEPSREPSAHYIAMLGSAYARGNQRARALTILAELTRRWKEGLASAFDVAAVYAALGDKERALASLERGYEERDYWLVELKAWPWFDALASEPRFENLVRRLNLPQWANRQ